MSHFHNNALIGASGQGGAYNITDSVRFGSSATTYLTRTPTSAGNRKTYTFSAWVKRGKLGSYQNIFVGRLGSNDASSLLFWNSDALVFYDDSSGTGGSTYGVTTTQLFRDPSAWYHIVLAVDTTQATASNRTKLYVNGTQITSFYSASYRTQNGDTYINSTNPHNIGAFTSGSNHLDGYMTEVNFVDGQQLTPSSFGKSNEDTGVWQPKKYTGTYGTNGFYLNGSGVTDGSGNGNNWTNNNLNLSNSALTTYALMSDTPSLADEDTSNFATLNPLNKRDNLTLSGGNLVATGASAAYNNGYSTLMVPKNTKIYFEVTVVNSLAGGNNLAFYLDSVIDFARVGNNANSWGLDVGTYSTYYTSLNGTFTNTGISISNGHVTQMAIDQASGKIWLGINNTWLSSGNPSTGANPIGTISTTADYFIRALCYNSGSMAFNFGQRPFAYTPPTGYKKLNTFNLPDSNIVDGSQHFDILLYTGNGSNRSITGLNFSPDLVVGQSRSNAYGNWWFDTNRGATKQIATFVNHAESTQATMLTAFNSDGFNLGTDTAGNQSGATYVAWNWRGSDSAAVTNTNGTVTSTVSANPTSGFSVVTWTGNGANATIGHGLGVKPACYIVKRRNSATSWVVYHEGMATAPQSAYMYLETTNAVVTGSSTFWNNTVPTTTTFGVGSHGDVNASGGTYVAYVFANVEGFSKFGSYTGNGSANGPFVYTGFRPAVVLHKRTDAVSNWGIHTFAEPNGNGTLANDFYLLPNASNAQDTYNAFDAFSNGFKAVDSSSFMNANGGTYIYMAFAENPFKNSLAR